MSPVPRIEAAEARRGPPRSAAPRIGLVALSTDLTVEGDGARLIAPGEAALHVSRIAFENPTTPGSLRAMGPGLSAAADLLVPGIALAAIGFACTSASVTIRNDVVTEAVGRVRPNVPVVTPSLAARAAMRALGAGRIALLTPYLPETTEPMLDYLEAEGLEVVRAACFGLADDRDMARIDPEDIVDAALALDAPRVEALFLSCTALPALSVVAALEARLGKPVITSNQALFWALRGLAGLPPPPPGHGRILDLPWPGAGAPA